MSDVTAGSSPPSDSSSGAPIGGPASTAAAIALCQSFESTSTTAVGRSAPPVAGNSALATPAASAAASAPATRIVLRVAVDGKSSPSPPLSPARVAPELGGSAAAVVVAERAAAEQTQEEQRDGQATHGGAD